MSKDDGVLRLWRVLGPDAPCFAVLDGDRLVAVEGPLEELHLQHRQGRPFITTGELGSFDQASILAPSTPSKIVCVGLNYRRHAEEMNKPVPDEPLLFLKPSTSVLDPGLPIELPPQSEEVHHEGELAIVIGQTLKDASPEEAMDAVFGYTCALDITARDIQRREKRYTRAKGFDTFAPFGPAIALAPEFTPGKDHHLRCLVNDELRQSSPLDDFIFPIDFVLSFISRIMTLLPGDLVFTGTPHGVGPIRAGERVRVEIDGIGTLENPVGRRR